MEPAAAVLFTGVPSFTDGEAVLFDSSRDEDADRIPQSVTLKGLGVSFPAGSSTPESLDPGLSLLIFVDDLSSPRARVRLADMVRQGGERPLNLLKAPGQVVQIVLVDPAGAWAGGAPEIEVAMNW